MNHKPKFQYLKFRYPKFRYPKSRYPKSRYFKFRDNLKAIFFCLLLVMCCLFTGCTLPGKSDSGQPAVCTISIECQTILENMDDLKKTKAEFVPEDGWILPVTEVDFTTGDSVFDILKKICGEKGIQISSRYTPLYDSYYIEGINQIYEFDCGKNSGWMYSVNGKFPNYGASAYKPEDGDKIEWKYTCNLGDDVGNPYQGEK